MRKKIGKIACLCLAVLLVGNLCPLGGVYGEADVRQVGIVSDNFDGAGYSERIWSRSTLALDRSTPRARIYTGEWDTALGYRGAEIDGDCDVSFKVTKAGESESGCWLGFYMGGASASQNMSSSKACIYSNNKTTEPKATRCMVQSGNYDTKSLDSNTSKDRATIGDSLFNYIADGSTVTCRYEIRYTHNDTVDENIRYYSVGVYFYVGETKGELLGTYEGLRAEGYCGIAVSGMTAANLDVTDFKIETKSGEVIAQDDFSDAKNWNNTFGKRANVGRLNRVSTENLFNGMLLSANEIKRNEQSDIQFAASVDIAVEKLYDAGTAYGFGLGLSSSNRNVDDVNMLALKPTEDKSGFTVVLVKQGQVVKEGTETVVENGTPVERTVVLGKEEIVGAGNVRMSVTGYQDKVTVSVAEYSCDFQEVQTVGRYAIGCADLTDHTTGNPVFFDNFEFCNYEYKSSNTESVSLKFGGYKQMEADGYVYYQAYLSNKWYASNVSVPEVGTGDVEKVAKYASFMASAKSAAFAYKKPFGEYICRFTFTPTQGRDELNASARIGISFGAGTPRLNAETASGVYFCNNAKTGKTDLCFYQEGVKKSSVECPVDVWAEKGNTVDVMAIVYNRTVSLFFAVRSEDGSVDKSAMQIERFYLEDVDTYGYVGAMSSYAALRLTQFAVTNINEGK